MNVYVSQFQRWGSSRPRYNWYNSVSCVGILKDSHLPVRPSHGKQTICFRPLLTRALIPPTCEGSALITSLPPKSLPANVPLYWELGLQHMDWGRQTFIHSKSMGLTRCQRSLWRKRGKMVRLPHHEPYKKMPLHKASCDISHHSSPSAPKGDKYPHSLSKAAKNSKDFYAVQSGVGGRTERSGDLVPGAPQSPFFREQSRVASTPTP